MNHKQEILAVVDRDWMYLYPTWVKDTFKKALKSEVLPPFAQNQLSKAMKVAYAINKKMREQTSIEVTSVSKRDYSHQKKDKKARDAEYRAKMKGSNPSPQKYSSKK